MSKFVFPKYMFENDKKLKLLTKLPVNNEFKFKLFKWRIYQLTKRQRNPLRVYKQPSTLEIEQMCLYFDCSPQLRSDLHFLAHGMTVEIDWEVDIDWEVINGEKNSNSYKFWKLLRDVNVIKIDNESNPNKVKFQESYCDIYHLAWINHISLQEMMIFCPELTSNFKQLANGDTIRVNLDENYFLDGFSMLIWLILIDKMGLTYLPILKEENHNIVNVTVEKEYTKSLFAELTFSDEDSNDPSAKWISYCAIY